MKRTVYTVRACRWGDADNHSYIVGVYPTEQTALKAADIEEEWRGGKYECEIQEWTVGEGIEGREVKAKIIKALKGR